jgi:NAD(P)-dependent dehydrogenase (short-subunit alcohol dehydrogenase family)
MTGAGSLELRTALVTGAAQGIGAAIALALAECGAMVVCGDVEPPQATVEQIRAAGGRADAVAFDVSRASEVGDALEFVASRGGVDILVNNAGVFPRSPALELEEAEWDRVLAVNLKGTFLCSQAAARMMREQARGGHYAASKAGIVALTRVLALELAPLRVTVNAVAPGLTDTAQPRSFYSDDDLAAIAQRIPLGAIAQPAEIVPAVIFLCGEGAAYVTGQTVHVNGGLFMP